MTANPNPHSTSLSQQELRAAALRIVEQQYAKRQEAPPVVGLASKARAFKGTPAATNDVPDTESSDGMDEDFVEHSSSGFQITHPVPLSARRPSHALHATPKGTIPCWAYVLCLVCVAGAAAFTVYWVTRPQVIWQWELLPDYTQQAVLRATNNNTTTPQAQAWEWLQQHPDFDQLTEWRVFQLMGVATVYYANYYLQAWPPLEIDATFPHECEWWLGSRCNPQGRYTKLSLYQRAMDGSLPQQLGFLSHLEELTFSDNQLTGPLPSQLGALTALTFVGLHSNRFTGSLPTQLGRLTAASQLSLRKNNLSGPLPSQLGSLTSARTMDLSNNRLTGTLPLQYARLSSALSYLPLWGNRNLTGALPSQLGALTKLTALDVHATNLEGSIPIELRNLLRMRSLLFHDTLLSGTIPMSLCREAVNLMEIWVDCGSVNCTCEECRCGDEGGEGPQ